MNRIPIALAISTDVCNQDIWMGGCSLKSQLDLFAHKNFLPKLRLLLLLNFLRLIFAQIVQPHSDLKSYKMSNLGKLLTRVLLNRKRIF